MKKGTQENPIKKSTSIKDDPNLPRSLARAILGSIVLILFVIVLINLHSAKKQTVATISAHENKFKINFDISKGENQAFLETLEKLGLPQSVKESVEFELDATTSAKLSFLVPIESKLNFSQDNLIISGSSHSSFLQEAYMEDFKLPASTNLAVFAPNFREFITAKFNFPKQFNSWLDNHMVENGQYLAVFGQNADYVVIFKAKNVDFESLKDIELSYDEPVYKQEESQEGVNFHLLNLPKRQADKSLTVTLFEIGPWIFITSSYDAAQELVKVQKSEIAQVVNFRAPKNEPVSLVILFNNQDQYPMGENFRSFLLPEAFGFAKTLEKVSQLQFVLKGKQFSALINIK